MTKTIGFCEKTRSGETPPCMHVCTRAHTNTIYFRVLKENTVGMTKALTKIQWEKRGQRQELLEG